MNKHAFELSKPVVVEEHFRSQKKTEAHRSAHSELQQMYDDLTASFESLNVVALCAQTPFCCHGAPCRGRSTA